jgi:uncharacterized membrane protein (UPF0182 family)
VRVPVRVSSPRVSRRALVATLAAVIVLLILIGSGATFYTDLLWYREIGFSAVFTTQIWTKFLLALVFGALFAAVLLCNLWVVQKVTSPTRLFTLRDQVLERYRATLRPYVRRGVVGVAVLFGLFAGSGAVGQWRNWLLFSHAEPFGTTDPVFSKDIGFYVFRLPFLRFLFTWSFSSLLVITIIVGVAHYVMGGIRPGPAGQRVTPQVKAHLSVLLGALVLLKAWGYRLDQYFLLYSPRGTVTGASYTDVRAQLPALRLLVVIAIVSGLLFLVNIRLRGWTLPAAAVAILALTSILVGGLYPALVQRFRVTPQERLRERPYIARNIEATRAAFGIDDRRVTVKEFPAEQRLDLPTIQRNRATVENIRLWSPDVLTTAYTQLQRITPYYEFLDVDIDRYAFDGTRRQVMISAREIAQGGLPASARTWINNHLVYTHGFGVVASRVNSATPEGQPDFIIRDIPGTLAPGLPPIAEPRIYFGETEDVPFVVVNTAEPEVDYPAEGRIQYTRYRGTGGIPLAGLGRRAAFAWRFRDVNLLISGAIRGDSRIIFRRTVADRLTQAAPFLKLDGDPYIAIVDGRLTWIQDAYTTTDMYPYAQRVDLGAITGGGTRISGVANYIRNSVKATVDATNGTVTLYVFDETDPLVRAWRRVWPGIFRPLSAASPGLRAHFRYPEDLFLVQAHQYRLYHMTDPNEFYAREDAWRIPDDPTAPPGQERPFPPYYVLMRLPGETREEFILMLPFAPFSGQQGMASRRTNMTAWLAARSDPENYGQLISFVFPRQKNVPGPEQIQARINQDPAVSQQITLWGQLGSTVRYGNVLVIPIEDSILYVQPLYLAAARSPLPELKRVVVVAGDTVRMGETLEGALAAVFGAAPPAPIEGTPGTPPAGSDVASLLREALAHYDRAQEALRQGDLARFQRELEAMKAALDRAAERTGPAPGPTPTPR